MKINSHKNAQNSQKRLSTRNDFELFAPFRGYNFLSNIQINLIIALAAFAVGVATVSFLTPNKESRAGMPANFFSKPLPDARQMFNRPVSERVKEPLPFFCHDKVFAAVLKDEKVAADTEDFEEYVERGRIVDCEELLIKDAVIDLNNDGSDEIIVRGKRFFCGGTGNCANWIYTKTGGQYRRILAASGEELKVEKTSTNGYRDIYMRGHYSASESTHEIYKFRKVGYQESSCRFEKYFSPDKTLTVSCSEAFAAR